ncbi:MAG: transcription antitermination factor NusB [Candidatus Aminicenantales bacterium]|jgi:N utilization substance protein B
MGKRRTARERALQVLYEAEFNDAPLEDIFRAQWAETPAAEDVRTYAEWLARGVVGRKDELDAVLRGVSAHWRVSRMSAVDRNILRLAVFELLEQSKVLAPAIIMNEAIEIAKRFSGEEAALFINGVLDAVRRSRGLPPSPRKVNDHEPRTEEKPGRIRARGGAEKERPGGRPGRKP